MTLSIRGIGEMVEDISVLDPREVVSEERPMYWYTYGWPPIKTGVVMHRSYLPEADIGTIWEAEHCSRQLVMLCIEVTEKTLTFRESIA